MPGESIHRAAQAKLQTAHGALTYYSLPYLEKAGVAKLDRLPFSIRVLLENALRHMDSQVVSEEDVKSAAQWDPRSPSQREFPFMPARVLMQDLTGVPAIVDLAALRSAMARLGGDPKRINPLVPTDLVIDHSVQVDFFGSSVAFTLNVEKEFERNRERYGLLRWAQRAFHGFRVVPPGTGIVHQVNLEYLASVVTTQSGPDGPTAFPDTVVGTDSHTTMINGLGVLGWGVGGIEAEAVLLGQPYYMLLPQVVGFKLTGELQTGVTATDLVLTVTEMLRKKGAVDKFVEFYGPGLSKLPLADRATIGNMSPEYGSTVAFSPIDDQTLAYLRGTGRDRALVDTVERYAKLQNLFRTDATPDPQFSDTLELDMSTVVPSLAGPRRPQDRVAVKDMKRTFQTALGKEFGKAAGEAQGDGQKAPATAMAERSGVPVNLDGQEVSLDHGAVVIAAITSCTNTSNPSVMIGAGLLAKKAVARGLSVKPWVKTSMAPGSRVVADYLEGSGLMPFLEALRFHIVGFGCTTCIGNSGPLPEPVSRAVTENDLVVAAVLSGNRNFEGRIHPQVKANYLASPMLVVAYALAGRVDIDLMNEPLGRDPNHQPVYLRDIWPDQEEIRSSVAASLKPELFTKRYGEVFQGDEEWRTLPVPQGDLYAWEPDSTYVREVPFFQNMPKNPPPLHDIAGARVLASLGDSVTTDHISPAGDISQKSPAGQYLISKGVQPVDFNSYGARRGNHEVMMRGTFANVRLRNKLTPDREGPWTVYLPTGETTTIFDASVRYQAAGVPLIVLAGKEYGSGSSRDWAAKGPNLLGVKAAIAESFERIHRSNLVGMGVLPLQYLPGQNAQSLGLTGAEVFDVTGVAQGLKPGQEATVTARGKDGKITSFKARVRIDTPIEVEYFRHGGILHMVLRKILRESGARS